MSYSAGTIVYLEIILVRRVVADAKGNQDCANAINDLLKGRLVNANLLCDSKRRQKHPNGASNRQPQRPTLKPILFLHSNSSLIVSEDQGTSDEYHP